MIPGAWRSALVSVFPYRFHPDKVGHVLGFCAMAFCLTRARLPQLTFWWILLVALVLGSVTEALQFVAKDRTPSLIDVLLDVSGALLGNMAGLAVTRLAQVKSSGARRVFPFTRTDY